MLIDTDLKMILYHHYRGMVVIACISMSPISELVTVRLSMSSWMVVVTVTAALIAIVLIATSLLVEQALEGQTTCKRAG